MNEDLFWQLIEHSWRDVPAINTIRETAVASNAKKQLVTIGDHGQSLIWQMQQKLEQNLSLFGVDELTGFIRLFEERLFQIDREEVLSPMGEVSGDSFLYARAFIVGMGRDYYELIDRQPEKASSETEAGLLAFAGYKVHEEKFGEEFERNVVHCIESFSNAEGWG